MNRVNAFEYKQFLIDFAIAANRQPSSEYMHAPSPFDLDSHEPYRSWRERKLADYPADLDSLRVEIAAPPAVTPAERRRLAALLGKANMALFSCPRPRRLGKPQLLELGRQLGLERLDGNLCADENAVSSITTRPAERAGDYIPYTNRPLSWHTDGYYNPRDRQVRAWMLYCVRDAATGGENALLDHEIAYLRLRDQDPELVRALLHPEAMTVPPNHDGEREIRGTSVGPVFSVRDGHLHMRYSARTRNIAWRRDTATDAARDALDRLFSSNDGYIFRHKLAPGEGYVSNNVLHNRTGFAEPGGDHPTRLLLRTRYLDRTFPGSGNGSA